MTSAYGNLIIDAQHPKGRPYAWRITRDRDRELSVRVHGANYDGESEVGTNGPRNSSAAARAMLDDGKVVKFRLYDEGDIDEAALIEDGDGEYQLAEGAVKEGHPDYGLVYEGEIAIVPGADDDWLFAPLVDFGAGNYGCTEVRYQDDDGVWRAL